MEGMVVNGVPRLPEDVQKLLRLMAQRLEVSGKVMALQASVAVVKAYTATWIDVLVPDGFPRGDWADGALSVSPTVLDRAGAEVGCIFVWVSKGQLVSLEQGWYTDEPPRGWPSVEMVKWEA